VEADGAGAGLADATTPPPGVRNDQPPPADGADLATDARSQPVIELQNLSVTLRGHPVLKSLTTRVTGRCIGLLGPNGAGKTTLLNTLLGFYPSTTGSAKVLGRDIRERAVRQQIGYMPENDSFIAGMSGVNFVRYMGELSGLPPEQALERAHEVFFYVGLGEARYRNVEAYSLGMKQLVKLAQAIIHGPRLLFLDEPTNGLDPPARTRMLQLIREIRDSGEARVIISSHLLRDVEECCEEVLILRHGEIATYCNLAEQRRSIEKFLLLQVVGAPATDAGADPVDAFVAGLRDRGCEVGMQNRRRLRAVLPPTMEVRNVYELATALNVQIRGLDHKRDSLEDIFLRAMEGDHRPGDGS